MGNFLLPKTCVFFFSFDLFYQPGASAYKNFNVSHSPQTAVWKIPVDQQFLKYLIKSRLTPQGAHFLTIMMFYANINELWVS